jgi:dihydrofolate reductase
MRRLFLHINVSVDGYICDTGGDIDWHFADAEFQSYLDRLLTSIDGMIFGRVAFQQLAGYWPTAADGASPVQVARMHELPKYVLSRTLPHTDWHNSHLLGADPAAAIRQLKRKDGRDLALFAGAGAATSAVAMRVLDEIRLVVNPVLLGGGTRLFDGTYPKEAMRLAGTHQFASGAVLLTYRTSRG